MPASPRFPAAPGPDPPPITRRAGRPHRRPRRRHHCTSGRRERRRHPATPGNLTIFAPTNDAFVALLGKLGVTSLDDIPVATLKAVLLYHVVAGELDAVDATTRIPNHQGANTVGGLWLQFTAGPLQVSGANIVAVDAEAGNGTVHVIDQVLLRG